MKRNYHINKDSYHILIYGIVKNNDIKCISPFKEFSVSEDLKFIGFQFDRIDRLYQDYNHSTDILTISNSSPSQAMKDLWNETYPEIEGKCYCLIQNVRVSHYANGSVVYGYWIYTKDDETSDLLSDLRGDDINNMIIFCPDHVQSDQTPASFFYGKLLAELPSNEDEDELLAENFMKIHKSQNISSRSECLNNIVNKLETNPKNITLSERPEITVICNMCYCCT